MPSEELRAPENLDRVAALLRAVHTGEFFRATFDSFRVVEAYADTARKRASELLKLNPDYDSWVKGIPDPDKDKTAFMRAAGFGAAAALGGSIAWYLVARITGMEIGLIAIAVGYMVGRSVRRAPTQITRAATRRTAVRASCRCNSNRARPTCCGSTPKNSATLRTPTGARRCRTYSFSRPSDPKRSSPYE